MLADDCFRPSSPDAKNGSRLFLPQQSEEIISRAREVPAPFVTLRLI
jgi:hypothetical protein